METEKQSLTELRWSLNRGSSIQPSGTHDTVARGGRGGVTHIARRHDTRGERGDRREAYQDRTYSGEVIQAKFFSVLYYYMTSRESSSSYYPWLLVFLAI
jgi:hypothetical protein